MYFIYHLSTIVFGVFLIFFYLQSYFPGTHVHLR